MTAPVGVRVANRVGVLSIASPPANALSYELISSLGDAVGAVLDDGSEVLVITSEFDRFFAAGADLKLLSQATPEDFTKYLITLRAFIERLNGLTQPTIAVVDGLALGGERVNHLFATADAHEGISAFIDKRSTTFQ